MKEIFIRKKYLSFLQKTAFSPVIKVLTGLRRVGKSSLLQSYLSWQKTQNSIPEQNILYINKELFSFEHIKTAKDLFEYFQDWKINISNSEKFIVAIDEVQEIKEWERVINSILAEFQGNVDIIITGSNASLLSSDLATLLSGRYIVQEIFPFDFTEYTTFLKKEKTAESFQEYLRFGGMPGRFFLPKEEDFLFAYLQGIYSTVLLKDIVQYFSVRNVDFLKQLYEYVFANIGNIISAKKISDYLKSQKLSHSVETVLQYLHYGQDAFLLHKVPSCNPETKKFFEIYQKYYAGDLGIRNSICGYNIVRDRGRILENYVFLQLRSKGYNISIGRLSNGKEIDFIAEKQGNIIYFQVCYLLSDETVIEREYSSLESIHDSWPKYVLSMEEKDMGTRNGILHKKIYELEEII